MSENVWILRNIFKSVRIPCMSLLWSLVYFIALFLSSMKFIVWRNCFLRRSLFSWKKKDFFIVAGSIWFVFCFLFLLPWLEKICDIRMSFFPTNDCYLKVVSIYNCNIQSQRLRSHLSNLFFFFCSSCFRLHLT